ncbi:MAG: DUF1287 domain-containing protein [Methylococcales bacterium]
MATLKKTLCLTLMTLALPLAAKLVTDFVNTARAQVGTTVRYDSTYYTLDYPNGGGWGLHGCGDTRLRASHNMDLQKLVHEDMQHGF